MISQNYHGFPDLFSHGDYRIGYSYFSEVLKNTQVTLTYHLREELFADVIGL